MAADPADRGAEALSSGPRRGPGARGRAASFLATCAAAAIEAERAAGGCITLDYAVAGLRVRLRFAGEALHAAYGAALAHLAAGPGDAPAEPALTVVLWDCSALNVAMPHAPATLPDFTMRGEIAGCETDPAAAYDPSSGLFSILDMRNASAIVCARSLGQLAPYDRAAPLRAVFAWLARARGMQMVHAAAVAGAHGGVLVAGAGGAGKSNLAFACMRAGLAFLGDDLCCVATDPAPRVHGLYATVKLRHGDWAYPAGRAPDDIDPVSGKHLFVLSPARGDRLGRHAGLRAIVLPVRGNGTAGRAAPALEPIAPRQPLFELSRQSARMLPGAGEETFTTLARLVRRVPCYRLVMDGAPDRLPALLQGLIGSAPATP